MISDSGVVLRELTDREAVRVEGHRGEMELCALKPHGMFNIPDGLAGTSGSAAIPRRSTSQPQTSVSLADPSSFLVVDFTLPKKMKMLITIKSSCPHLLLGGDLLR
jgi:hypothetical protein